MAIELLTPLQVQKAKAGDKLSDGGGLRLDVDRNGSASWCFRFTSPATGKERYMGLGPRGDVGLAAARDAARAARELLRQGVDPIEHRNEQRTAAKVEASAAVTFQEFAEQYIGTKEAAWKSAVHRQQWRNTLTTYVYPVIGRTPVRDVNTDDVVAVLQFIWLTKRETAARIRGRIEKILDAAKAKKLRVGDNPALLGIVKNLLPEQKRKKFVVHHPALPYAELPDFWKSLATDTSDAARMLRWIILTACRFNEAAEMDSAIEVKGDVWTIPPQRTKADRAHVVPLTAAAREQLPFRPVSDVSLSNCIRRHTTTPATTHGMRSTFRDWVGDCTDFPREVAEMALAHAVSDETEAAYRRARALTKRRELMDEWAKYCRSSIA